MSDGMLASLILLLPQFMIFVGIAGLVACKDPRARHRAKNMVVWSFIWLGILVFLTGKMLRFF